MKTLNWKHNVERLVSNKWKHCIWRTVLDFLINNKYKLKKEILMPAKTTIHSLLRARAAVRAHRLMCNNRTFYTVNLQCHIWCIPCISLAGASDSQAATTRHSQACALPQRPAAAAYVNKRTEIESTSLQPLGRRGWVNGPSPTSTNKDFTTFL